MSSPPISAFISYAKADQAKAQEIAEALEERGFRCWIAPRDVRPGRAYGDEIIRGIESARALILVLSSASNESPFVSREIERAVSKRKPVFTVRVEDVVPAPGLELFISSTQWIDAYSGKLGPHVDRLASLLTDDESHAAPPPGAAPKPPPRRPLWRSPLVLAAVAAGLIVIAGVFAIFFVSGRDETDYAVLARSCERLSGDAAIGACNRVIGSRKFAGRDLGGLYAARGFQRQTKFDLEGALSDYREALRLDPAIAAVFSNRGHIYRDAGDYDKAVADFDQAIALDPRQSDALASRGWIFQQKGDLDRARRDYEQALNAEPSAELKEKLENALATIDPGYRVKQSLLQAGFFGSDTRRKLADFDGEEKERLLAAYGYVGVLADERGDAVCNATLVGQNLILTSNYCFAGREPQRLAFRILGPGGKLLEAKLTEAVTGSPIRGVAGDQRIALAKLATPLGKEIGWVKTVGGNPAAGDKLDIVAIDIRPGMADGTSIMVSGAATGDANCVVLSRQAGTDTFAHRCISPIGSGGAPIFDASTGTLTGIVGETDAQNGVALAYLADGAPALIGQAGGDSPEANDLSGTWRGLGHQTGGGEEHSYPVVMRITAGGGNIEYPSLRCGGSLTRLSAGGKEAQFRERIAYGNCVDGGTIDVALREGKLAWRWSGVGESVVVAELEPPCTVIDPTGTPLNVRDSPNGKVTGALANGLPVAIVESRTAANGKSWVRVVDSETQKPIGWVFREFVSCF
jgi:tetratricopeptide (TPR) repeat protein